MKEASFFFMRDNHTFIKLEGNNFHEIKKEAIKASKENPYGCLCPIIIKKDGKEIKRVGNMIHVDSEGNVNIEEWMNSIINQYLF